MLFKSFRLLLGCAHGLSICLLLLSLAGCQVDDILIDVIQEGDSIEFLFRYKGNQEVVRLTNIIIQEVSTGRVVWDLSIYDPVIASKMRERKAVLEHRKNFLDIEMVEVSRVHFGSIPQGFTQYFPAANAKPQLDKAKAYEMYCVGAGHRGHRLFRFSEGQN